MGIAGIYKEIGPGERIALAKLAVQHLQRTGQSFRIAIDIAIWQFQAQSGQGGQNPALRTIYYRLLRLASLGIHPLIVFDGPGRPAVKRGNTTHRSHSSYFDKPIKRMLECFGFAYHDAPGEAEAECALLQRECIVDAVLTEDVDVLMFGCTLSLRNWKADGLRGNKAPTHVDLYRADYVRTTTNLTPAGMILVALMSGGDYDGEALARCGPKIACQAARAGFGEELCALRSDDSQGLASWRQRLQEELDSNRGGFFQRKHADIKIPESFPDAKIWQLYQSPMVSSKESLHVVRRSMDIMPVFKVGELRAFVAEMFNWPYLTGAKQLIRGLAPAMLTQKCVIRGTTSAADQETPDMKQVAEGLLIKTIGARRTTWVTDGEPELKISYIPAEIVGLDLTKEEDRDRNDDNDDPAQTQNEESDREVVEIQDKRTYLYDPSKIDQIWIPETFLQLGVPLLLETHKEDLRDPKKFITRKAREKLQRTQSAVEYGSMDAFVTVRKAGVPRPEHKDDLALSLPSAHPIAGRNVRLPVPAKPPGQDNAARRAPQHVATLPKDSLVRSPRKPKEKSIAPSSDKSSVGSINPWSITKSGKSLKASPAKANRAVPVEVIDLDSDIEKDLGPTGLSRLCSRQPHAHTEPNVLVSKDVPLSRQRPGESTDRFDAVLPGVNATLPYDLQIISRPDITSVSEFCGTPSNESAATSSESYEQALTISPSKQKLQNVVLRESLEGTWKPAPQDPDASLLSKRRTYKDVEIVNLT